jgi:hypothetical protein
MGLAGWGMALAAATVLPAQAAEELPTREEMWNIIQQQQRQIDGLQGRQKQTEQKVEATGEAIERTQKAGASSGPGWWERTSLGGYGEMHYNGNGGSTDIVDFHRFVLFVDHEFTDWLRFYSELEIEHALVGDGKPGEVELEQALIEADYADDHSVQAGVFLVPVGIINPTHEPPTFFGVERNPIETNIIPSTWWEGGAGFKGRFDTPLPGALGRGFSYEIDAHSGLQTPTTGSNAFLVRKGRQKVAKATAEDPAFTGRLRWAGIPGVEIGVTGHYQEDVTQSSMDVEATLFEAHIDARHGGWGLRALYARWDLFGNAPELIGRDVQKGFYIEPSYRVATGIGEVGVFTRFNQWNNTAGDAMVADQVFNQVDVGVNYWPHPDVALKVDYQFIYAPAGTDGDDQVNAGIGFQF